MADSELTDADRVLIAEARVAWGHAYAPISRYRVGAALRAEDGSIHRGANVENIVLPLTCCAEQVALFHAVALGHRAFESVAVFTPSSPPAPPCGSCRQLLFHWRIGRVILANDLGETKVVWVDDLLPHAFHLEDPPE